MSTNYHVALCDTQTEWDAFVQESEDSHSVLHSWEWGQMQAAVGRTVYRLAVYDGKQMIAAALCIVMPLPAGRTYLFSPRGPVMHDHVESDIYRTIQASEDFLRICTEHNSIFWRFEPLVHAPATELHARQVEDVEPSMTSMIDLSASTDELLSRMKQKTRYNIRLAEKKNVEVRWYSVSESDTKPDWERLTDDFWNLVCETSERHNRQSHPKAYYAAMLRVLGNAGVVHVAAAYYNNQLLAMNILFTYGNTFTYAHGAATHQHKSVMAPYALQWACIQRAQAAGYKWYDFYGIGPDDPKHKLFGVTKFKIGFAGDTVTYPGTFEFACSRIWYRVYTIVKSIR